MYTLIIKITLWLSRGRSLIGWVACSINDLSLLYLCSQVKTLWLWWTVTFRTSHEFSNFSKRLGGDSKIWWCSPFLAYFAINGFSIKIVRFGLSFSFSHCTSDIRSEIGCLNYQTYLVTPKKASHNGLMVDVCTRAYWGNLGCQCLLGHVFTTHY